METISEDVELLKVPASKISFFQQTNFSVHEIKMQSKRKEGVVCELQRKIKRHRQQMKKLSKEASVALTKSVKINPKQRPVFNHSYKNEKLMKLNQQKTSLYRQIDTIKAQIQGLQKQNDVGLTSQILMLQDKNNQKDEEIKLWIHNAKIIKSELQLNKGQIQKLKGSFLITDVQMAEKQFEEVRRECKNYQKQINQIITEELKRSMFLNELKSKIERLDDQRQIAVIDHTKKEDIINLIDQINQIHYQKQDIERSLSLKIKNLQKNIVDQQRLKAECERNIREQTNEILKHNLEGKRFKSQIFIKKPTDEGDKRLSSPIKKQTKSTKPKVIHNIYLTNQEDDNSIIVGEWAEHQPHRILSDQNQLKNHKLIKVKSIVLYIQKEVLLGLKCIYQDQNGKIFAGKQLRNLQIKNYSEQQIDVQNLSHIEHLQKGKQPYLKLIFYGSTPKEIGTRMPTETYERISLEHYMLRTFQVMLGVEDSDTQSKLVGLRIVLDDRPAEEKVAIEENPQKKVVKSQSSNELSQKKKVIIRGKTLKKFNEEAPVDLRMMLNRNKVV